ncbi:MAG: DUF5107 domain-containing protein, partial [Bacteroidetes bacterium]|nr:DUF5107 domain-containing protein [Bacteroidota bacterium]
QWTWGNGDFGQAWDRNLTDEDGPYIELMTGVFTDNQPDFSWLQPNEEKTFEQYFMPYTRVGQVKNATREAMLNMEWEGDRLRIAVYTTAVYTSAVVRLLCKGRVVQEWIRDISPREVFEETHRPKEKGSKGDWALVVCNADGEVLVAWQDSNPRGSEEIPPAATAAKKPAEIEQVEDLYLNGLHLEQYRHATFNPIDYYEEGLRRSPGDIRCNNAMGLLLLRRGQFALSEPYFRRAVSSITRRNPNPYDGEPYYNLGWSLKLQGRLDEAYDAFYKAVWNDAWQHSGYLALARIASAQGRWKEALGLIEKSLVRNYHSPVARHLKAVLLGKLGGERDAFIRESLAIDAFNFGCLFEQGGADFSVLMRDSLNNYLELSLDYAQAGLYEEADRVLECYKGPASPLIYYYRGWFSSQVGRGEAARVFYSSAAAGDAALCFPNKIEEVLILQDAIRLNPGDARARYYLGNLWYDKRQYTEAIACWEESIRLDDRFPTVFRNLALAYYNKLGKKEEAIALLEKAFAQDPSDARVLMELDQLYKIMGRPFSERLQMLERYPRLVDQRDDLYLERVTLYNQLKEYEMAKRLLSLRKFHPWEGGEGKVVGQYLLCHMELAKQAIGTGRMQEAMELLVATESYPDNLGEGKLYGAQENDRLYWMGCVYEGLGNTALATDKFREATVGISQPAQAIYYNDPQPDQIIYQALAWYKLGESRKARQIFESLVAFGTAHRADTITIDYFAVSLPDMLVFDQDITQRNVVHCKYLIGLGYLGLGDEAQGVRYLQEVAQLDPNHKGAAVYLQMLPFFQQAQKQAQVC